MASDAFSFVVKMPPSTPLFVEFPRKSPWATISKQPVHTYSSWQVHSKKIFRTAAVLIVIIVLFFHLGRIQVDLSRFGQTISNSRIYSHSQSCRPDFGLLRELNLTPSIQYGRTRMVVEHTRQRLNFTESLDQQSPTFRSLDLVEDDESPEEQRLAQANCAAPITVHVPLPKPCADASHIIFGVSTTVARLESSVSQMQHWLSHSGARLIAVVEPSVTSGLLETNMRNLGIDVTIRHSNETFNDRYFALTKVLYNARRPNTRWAGIVDDDTFFLSMAALVDRLANHDHTEEKYIGSLTEDFRQIEHYGYMAYGGAGMFLSIPLLAKINNVYPECREKYNHLKNGDGRIAQCIYHYTTTKLTWEPDLHQIDLYGDPSGFYEAGRRQPLSIHHWKHWYPIDVVKMSAVSAVCGEACILKRWKFADGWYLTNGYSVVHYGEQRVDDVAMELTWNRPDEQVTPEEYEHSLTPLRPKAEGKVTYRLEEVVQEGGVVRQFYVYRPGEGLEDRVMEVSWSRR
ncbi:hypothetical protein MMC11_006606 [Xylographa trunciseda]|nr:hypothetical protein [Xylographa trunciseda]